MRARVEGVSLSNCVANNCSIGPANLDDVRIENLATNDLLILWGALFRHVTLIGKFGKIKINPEAHHEIDPVTQHIFDSQRQELYQGIDWSLDISGAEFREFDLRGVPAHLIRRDPSRQFVITRDKALSSDWRDRVSDAAKEWMYAIDIFIEDGEEDGVLVIPSGKSKKKREKLLEGLCDLRELGVLSV